MLDEFNTELVGNSIAVPDDATEKLCDAARRGMIYAVMGLNEWNRESGNTSLYNLLLYIDDTGKILGKHRELIPTGSERTAGLEGMQHPGSLRYGHRQAGRADLLGELCAAGPLRDVCLEDPDLRRADLARGELWLATPRHIAKEGGALVVGCAMPLRLADIPERFALKALCAKGTDWIHTGHSCIVDPGDQVIAGPLIGQEGILCAAVDLGRIPAAKRMFDVAGDYARPDVPGLTVNRKPNPVMRLPDVETLHPLGIVTRSGCEVRGASG